MAYIGPIFKQNLNGTLSPNNIGSLTAVDVYRVVITNTDTVDVCVRFYDRATSPTVGSYAPLKVFFVKAGTQLFIQDTIGAPLFSSLLKLWVAITTSGVDSATTWTGSVAPRIDIDYV